MVTLSALWLPILLSAVLVFVASAVAHMVLPHHKTDFDPVPHEERVMESLREAGVSVGEYVVPHAADARERSSEEFEERAQKGPMALITVQGPWPPAMTRQFVLWFLYCLGVGLIAAYVASRALPPGAAYLEVFRFTGTTAFVAYSVGIVQDAVWYGRGWSRTFKDVLDGVAYALLTAGAFGWLWPG